MGCIRAKRTSSGKSSYQRKGRTKKTYVPVRSRKIMTYHGRTGKPVIHRSKNGKQYIMVRKSGGGTKRLYLKGGRVPVKYRR